MQIAVCLGYRKRETMTTKNGEQFFKSVLESITSNSVTLIGDFGKKQRAFVNQINSTLPLMKDKWERFISLTDEEAVIEAINNINSLVYDDCNVDEKTWIRALTVEVMANIWINYAKSVDAQKLGATTYANNRSFVVNGVVVSYRDRNYKAV